MTRQNLTKKQLKLLRRQLREKERQSQLRQKQIKKLILWLLVIGGLTGAVFGLSQLTSHPSQDPSLLEAVNIITDNDWSKGPTNAGAVLIEYSDFQCPACRTYYPLVKELAEEFADRLMIVYRHFPLRQIHPFAQLAAQAAEAAGRQGKFWAMHDLLFERQNEWSKSKKPKDIFVKYAAEINLDQNRFLADLTNKSTKTKVNNDYLSGIKFSVQGTPTFFLNGRKLTNPKSYDEFSSLINAVLKKIDSSNSQ